MIAYIRGKFTTKTPTLVHVDVQGLGYEVHVSLHTYSQIQHLAEGTLYTLLIIKEDAHVLYGFAEPVEKQMFQQLISVSGVGPTTAQIVLSSLTPAQVGAAIQQEDERIFHRVKGIGPKTAKRIIIDLKDKVIKIQDPKLLTSSSLDNTIRSEALSALVTLGFNRPQAQKTVDDLLKNSTIPWSVESLLKEALKVLS